MATYKSRLIAPSATNKNWIHYSKGGYNYCIEIKNGSCLPNCVGYAWGRWREILGKKHNLSRANAENWWGNTSDGYKRGQTPKVGAIMCWRKGKAGVSSDGAGHVAVVEKVKSDGSVVYSNSAYGGTRFYTKTLKAPYKLGSAFTFQGFIYLPITFEDAKKEPAKTTTTTKPQASQKSLDAWAKEVIDGKHGNGHSNREASLKKAGCPYAYEKVKAKVNELYGVKTSSVSKPSTKPSTKPSKSLDAWAKEVIDGKYGNGHANRESALKKAGCPYSYAQVRARVNALSK